MFATPIFWPPENLQGSARFVFVHLNPIYHLLNIVRSPMLGRVPALESYLAVLFIMVLGWGMTFVFFNYFRKRIPYWS